MFYSDNNVNSDNKNNKKDNKTDIKTDKNTDNHDILIKTLTPTVFNLNFF